MSKTHPDKKKPKLVANNRLGGGLLNAAQDFAVEQILACIKPVAEQACKQIFKIADKAPSNEAQNRCFEATKSIKKNQEAFHKDVAKETKKQFAALAGAAQKSMVEPKAVTPAPGELRLVDDEKLERSLAISGMTAKIKVRFTGPLYLLKRRFSAFAARSTSPPFNPLGPSKLAEILTESIPHLKLSTKFEVLYLKLMEKKVMKGIGDIYDALNDFLAESGVLPNLKYEPPKKGDGSSPPQAAEENDPTQQAAANSPDHKPPGAMPGAPANTSHYNVPAGAQSPGINRAGAFPRQAPGMASAPRTGVAGGVPMPRQPGRGAASGVAPPIGQADAGGAAGEVIQDTNQLLSDIRHLLSDQLSATTADLPPAPPVTHGDVQSALGGIQQQAPAKGGLYPPRDREHLWNALTQQLKQASGNPDQEVRLTHEDATTVDLVGMLFDYVSEDVVMQPTSLRLLGPLQVPVLQVALNDPNFLGNADHPARVVLNAVAELSNLLPATPDPKDRAPMEVSGLVRSAVDDCPNPDDLFPRLKKDLSQYIDNRKRKAEIAERRHVEAVKGKERLMLSRRKAQEVVAQAIKMNRPPRFLREMLEQAWADVLSLTMLRHKEDSDYWHGATETAETIAELGRHPASKKLIGRLDRIWEPFHDAIEGGLRMVGMYPAEVEEILATLEKAKAWAAKGAPLTAVPRALTQAFGKAAATGGGAAAPGKKTGQPSETMAAAGALDSAPKDHLAEPLQELPREYEKSLEIIRKTPFGTWFNLTLADQDTPMRAKLAWFSPVTDHCLFVNHRGVKCGPKSLRELAEEHAGGRAVIITEEPRGIIDRALKAVLGKLRDFKERISSGAKPEDSGPGQPQHAG